LHPIPKSNIPLDTIHIDHLGPFPLSSKCNRYLIVVVDSFTKFVFLKAVKSTDTKSVIEFLRDLFATYEVPKTIITDRGAAFKVTFGNFCDQNYIQHIKVAVTTPRANGQVERLNKSVMHGLLTTADEEKRWDQHIHDLQFAINNTVNQSTKTTPSQLLLGYIPRGGADAALKDEVQLTSSIVDNLLKEREEALKEIKKAQLRQKEQYDQCP